MTTETVDLEAFELFGSLVYETMRREGAPAHPFQYEVDARIRERLQDPQAAVAFVHSAALLCSLIARQHAGRGDGVKGAAAVRRMVDFVLQKERAADSPG